MQDVTPSWGTSIFHDLKSLDDLPSSVSVRNYFPVSVYLAHSLSFRTYLNTTPMPLFPRCLHSNHHQLVVPEMLFDAGNRILRKVVERRSCTNLQCPEPSWTKQKLAHSSNKHCSRVLSFLRSLPLLILRPVYPTSLQSLQLLFHPVPHLHFLPIQVPIRQRKGPLMNSNAINLVC